MKQNLTAALLLAAMALFASCAKNVEKDAQAFVDTYTVEFQKLSLAVNEAEWASNTHIVEGDTTNAHNSKVAKEAYAAFTGNAATIDQTRKFLEKKDKLSPMLVRQLDAILYEAGNNPQSVADIVKKRIKAETEQVEKLYGFDYQLNGKSVTTNDIDELLRSDNNLDERLAAWNESKEVGKNLREGLTQMQTLRNQTVQALGYTDYFQYQVSDYGMTTQEMRDQMQQVMKELWPLYRELHTWARYELAKKYGVKEVPDMIPAHWLPNRWGQDWSPMVTVEGLDLDSKLKEKQPEWLVKQAESFYVSLGFQPLPQTFWDKSSLYPVPEGANYKKNNHASAWHFDLDHDVRSLMSVVPNADWYETTHHELGHIYYYLSYSTPAVPILLRKGANRAYHEAVGSMMGLAAMQKPFIEGIGLFPEGQEVRSDADPAQGSAELHRLHSVVGRRDDRVRAFAVRRESPARSVQREVVGTGAEVPGHRAAGPAPRGRLRRRHQDPHQRRRRAVLRLRDFVHPAVPIARPHRARDPAPGPARDQLLRQQGGGRFPAHHSLARRNARLARTHARSHRRRLECAADAALLRSADGVPEEAERGTRRDAAGSMIS